MRISFERSWNQGRNSLSTPLFVPLPTLSSEVQSPPKTYVLSKNSKIMRFEINSQRFYWGLEELYKKKLNHGFLWSVPVILTLEIAIEKINLWEFRDSKIKILPHFRAFQFQGYQLRIKFDSFIIGEFIKNNKMNTKKTKSTTQNVVELNFSLRSMPLKKKKTGNH